MTKAVGETYNDMKAHEDRTVWEPLTILQEAALKLNTKDTYEHN